ncbi:MAG TPA: integrase arm-type DNA-binding domain-containing protein [Candidatus Sumerlaeota bacterium]|nr:integrase arm-type DNA-binding domain-containing protein [Candidatus Sumerlaeota bacterium]
MKTRLTPTVLTALEPRAKDQLIWDADLTGFYVKLTPAGHFVFMVYFRVKGRQYRRRIGAWPEMTPEAAREAAREVLAQAHQEGTPPERKRSGKGAVSTFGSFWETVVWPDIETRFAATTAGAYRRLYRRYVKPVWAERRFDSIAPSDVVAFRSSLPVSPSVLSRVMGELDLIFQKAVEHRLISVNPVESEKPKSRTNGVRHSSRETRQSGASVPERENRGGGGGETEGAQSETAYREEEWDVELPDPIARGAGFFSCGTASASIVEGDFEEHPTAGGSSERLERTMEGGADESVSVRPAGCEEAEEPIPGVVGGLGGRSWFGRRLPPRRALPVRLISGPERDEAFVERIVEIAVRPDSRILSYYEPKGHICEEYRLLGKNLLHTLAALPEGDMASGKVVVLSSAVQGEGKTLTCVNLALTLAQDLYDRVVLVDCDLRYPKIHRYLGVTSPPGGMNRLLSVEEPEAVLEECLVRTEGGLHLLLAKASELNPAQLLDGESMARLLAVLRKRYSLVIVDSPPVLTATDALSVGARSDGMLFLLRARRTQREQIQEARQRIARLEIRMLGYVINNVRSFLPQIWRKYYYGNY